MLFLRRPTEERICAELAARKSRSWSYAQVGATRTTPPCGWRINDLQSIVGTGRSIRDQLAARLFGFKLLGVAGVEVFPRDATARPNLDVALLSRHFGIWSLDFCRVIYVLRDEPEENGAILRTGFAYGTLPGHAIRGEEIFSIEWRPAIQEVRYHIFSFSSPANLFIRFLSPIARATQTRFARASLARATAIARESQRAR
jgi:uncharacterized protein (UPF0548 family)